MGKSLPTNEHKITWSVNGDLDLNPKPKSL